MQARNQPSDDGGSFFSNCGPFYRNLEIAVSSKLAYPGKIAEYAPRPVKNKINVALRLLLVMSHFLFKSVTALDVKI